MSADSPLDQLVPILVGVLVVGILLYSALIAQQLLVGVLAAALPVVGYLLWRAPVVGDDDRAATGNGGTAPGSRRVPTEGQAWVGVVALALSVFGYGIVVLQRLLPAVVAAAALVGVYYVWRISRTLERIAARPPAGSRRATDSAEGAEGTEAAGSRAERDGTDAGWTPGGDGGPDG